MKSLKKPISTVLIILINLFVLNMFILGCNKGYQYYEFYFTGYYNTNSKVTIYTNETIDKEKEDLIYNEIDKILDRVDKTFNIQDRGDGFVSKIMEVNREASKKAVIVNDEVIYVLKEAIRISELSVIDGFPVFDITIAPLWDKWNFIENMYNTYLDNRSDIPSDEEIKQILPLVNYKNIVIDEDNKTVFLKEKGTKIDFGGIVKGYVSDLVKEYLESLGYNKAVIDIGGNIVLVGSSIKDNNDCDWKVLLKTPYIIIGENNNDIKNYGTIYLSDKTIVTSGIYEKYIMTSDNQMYHHILDPKTGYPFANGVVSISIITTSSISADGYSTMLLGLGLDKGMEFVEKEEDLEAIYVIKNEDKYEIYVSSGLKDNFVFNENVSKLGYVQKEYKNENKINLGEQKNERISY